MNDDLLENLLFEEESETLDFKSHQYPFDGASDDQKSELLKDILAFANSWRRTDAYILIGVKEVKGAKSKVLGINDHLLNRNLQQFVNSKTNRPLTFSYRPYKYEETEIGILKIPIQQRPIFLVKNFGKLVKETVYIRRGDTTTIADPDEIARMGRSFEFEKNQQPEINFQLADIDNKKYLGSELKLKCEKLFIENIKSIPKYGEPEGSYFVSQVIGVNHNYFRDIAEFLEKTHHLRKIGLVLKNDSNVLAENVLVTISICDCKGLSVVDEYDYPVEPSDHTMGIIPNFRRPFDIERQGNIEAKKHGSEYSIRSEFKNVQPGAEIWSNEAFYIGSEIPNDIELQTEIVANNLNDPIQLSLNISIESNNRKLESEDIQNYLESISD
jgi:hypothetical protein